MKRVYLKALIVISFCCALFCLIYFSFSSNFWYKISEILCHYGKYSQAVTLLEKTYPLINSNYQNFYAKKIIKLYIRKKEFQKAIHTYEYFISNNQLDILKRSISINPKVDKGNIYYDLSYLYFRNNNIDKAILNIKKSINLKLTANSDYVIEDYILLSYIYLKENKFSEVENLLTKINTLIKAIQDPIIKEENEFKALLLESEFYLKTKNYQLAKEKANLLFIKIPTKTLPLKTSFSNFQNYYTIKILKQIAQIEIEENNFLVAETQVLKTKTLIKETYGEKSPEYLCALNAYLNIEKALNKNTNNIEFTLNSLSNELKLFEDSTNSNKIDLFCNE